MLVLRFNFEFNLTLPTSDKSYLSFLKYKLLKISSAISKDGTSPGLNILYISPRASFLLEFLSILRLSRIYGPLLIGSIFTTINSLNSNFKYHNNKFDSYIRDLRNKELSVNLISNISSGYNLKPISSNTQLKSRNNLFTL